jgi:gamma-glutamylputrescine oxidase
VGGLGRAAARLGAVVVENATVQRIRWAATPELQLAESRLRVAKVLLATNALSSELSGLQSKTQSKLTLAARTAPLAEKQIAAIGLAARKPFYTVDFPYLWGRLCGDRSIVWGAGLVDPPESGDLGQVDVTSGHAARLFETLGTRIRGLHPDLAKTKFTHVWGGPIAFRANFQPVFSYHPASRNGIVVGVFAGHGVALSVHCGVWAAEALLGRRELPEWGRIVGAQNVSSLW